MIPAWLLTDAARKIGLYLLLTGALFGVLRWYGNHVREDERAKQADKQTQEIEKLRAADRAQVQEVLNEAQAKQEAAERRMQASLDREAGLVRSISAIQTQRVTASSDVQRVGDSELHTYNVRNLGIRPEGTTGIGCYLPIEERAIATALTQLPLCEKQVAAQKEQIQEIKEQVAAQTAKIDAMEVKFDALSGYTTRLEGYYVTVYNAVPRKKRSPKCLWLWQCGKKPPLPVPAPLDLKKPAP